MTIDNKGKQCASCAKGVYGETSIHDDIDGVLHCTECGIRVERYTRVMTERKMIEEGEGFDVMIESHKSQTFSLTDGEFQALITLINYRGEE